MWSATQEMLGMSIHSFSLKLQWLVLFHFQIKIKQYSTVKLNEMFH